MDRYYLMIDGIDAPSPNPQYPDAIEILSFILGKPSNSNSSASGGGQGQPEAITSADFIAVSTAETRLFSMAAATGRHFAKAIIVNTRNEGSRAESENVRIIFTDVLFSGFSSGGSGSGGTPMDAFSLDFTKIEYLFGFIPPTIVQPDHRHLINRLKFLSNHRLSKPAGKI